MKKNNLKNISHAPIKKLTTEIKKTSVSKPVRSTRSITLRTYFTIVVIIFTILAYFAHHIAYFPIDLVITKSIQSFHPFWFDFIMKATSFLGYTPQVDIFVVVIVVFMYLVGLRFESIVSTLNALLITLINLGIKDIVNRPRPSSNLVHVYLSVSQTSFPSGHVMFYLAFFGYFWFLAYTMLKKSLIRTGLLWLLSLTIVLIGPSRIYLGAHWASDVTGAYLISSIWLLIVINIHNWGKSRFFVKQPIAPENVR